jgi:hypothetical protein
LINAKINKNGKKRRQISLIKFVALKRAVWVYLLIPSKILKPARHESSLAKERRGCSAKHHLVQWLHQRATLIIK